MLCIKLFNYWDKYTEMHGQQNVKNKYKMRFSKFYLQHFFEASLILRRIQQDIAINTHRSSCKAPIILLTS